MSDPALPFDRGRARPLVTVLDMLRKRIDHDDFDAVIFSLGAVAADLGYGDVQPLSGSIAWIDRLRREGKRIAGQAAGERAAAALELAGIADRGSPNHGSTVFSKRVMAQIRSPESVRTRSPTPCRLPSVARR